MPNITNHEYLVSCINKDINNIIETYLEMLDRHGSRNSATNLLNVMGAMQACLQEFYKRGLGEKETAMLYYSMADRIVAHIVDRENNAKS